MRFISPRVLKGIFKNKNILIPNHTRPITERVKRSMFDTLGDLVNGSTVADIFCGGGTIGIECLSRGAAHVTFVDQHRESIVYVAENLKRLDVPKTNFTYFKQHYRRFLRDYQGTFDFIFIDPPFDGFKKETKFGEFRKVCLTNTIIIFKVPQDEITHFREGIINDFEILDHKRSGVNNLLFCKIAE